MTARFIVADVFDGLASLETGSVDLVVTSPPFLALRSYLPADHELKSKEIGSEGTPAEWIDTLLKVTAELRRVLAPHGSICVELGDTYASSGGATTEASGSVRTGGVDGRPTFTAAPHIAREGTRSRMQFGDGWPLAKSRTLIPSLYEIALAYGFNPLTGSESPAGQWRIRNIITWARPNPPVGALGDKWRPATSDLVIACTSPKRYWDDLATRKPHQSDPASYSGNGYSKGFPEGIEGNESMPGNSSGAPLLDYWVIPLLEGEEEKPYGPTSPKSKGQSRHREGVEARTDLPSQQRDGNWRSLPQINDDENGQGAPLLDYWVIPPGGYTGSHYAVFPEELVIPCVQAMCPQKVCVTCGEPSRRIVSEASYVGAKSGLPYEPHVWPSGVVDGKAAHTNKKPDEGARRISETLGWSDCGHGSIVCRSCSALVPYDYAIRRPREATPVRGGVGQETLLGEPVEGEGGQEEASGDLRSLRRGVLGANRDIEDLQPVLFGEAGAHGGADEHTPTPPQLDWTSGAPRQIRGDLHSGVGSEGLSGSAKERMDDGASGSDAGSFGQTVGTVGVGPPSERDQDGQPDRESGDRDSRSTVGNGDLPELPASVRGSLTGYVCGCGSIDFKYVADHWRPGLVLDPFAGSGTTLAVATGHGHDAIGIDLDHRNLTLARDRVGPFLFEEVEIGELQPGSSG